MRWTSALKRIGLGQAAKTFGTGRPEHGWSATFADDRRLFRLKQQELKTRMKAEPAKLLSALTLLLSDSDPNCRGWAANTIRMLGTQALPAVPDLVGLLGTSDHNLLSNLSDILNGLGSEGRDALINAIGDRRPEIRRGAIRALRYHPPGTDHSVASLLRILKKNKVGLREAAAESLGSVAAARGVGKEQRRHAIAELTRLLTDLRYEEDTWILRKAAIESLSTLARSFGKETAVAIPAVIMNLEDEMTENAAASTLIGFGRISVPALIRMLETGESGARIKAAKILGKMEDEAGEAGPALAAALNDPDENLKCEASGALGGIRIESLSVAARLIEAFADPDDRIRENAAFALARMNAKVVPMLIRALEDKRPLIREGACLALQHFPAWDKEQAIPVLKTILYDDTEHQVRFRAAQALCAASESEARKLPDKLIPTAPNMKKKAFFSGNASGIVFVRFASKSPLGGVLVKENSGYALRYGCEDSHHDPDLFWDLTLEGAPEEKCRKLVGERVRMAGIKLNYRFLVREILRSSSG